MSLRLMDEVAAHDSELRVLYEKLFSSTRSPAGRQVRKMEVPHRRSP